MKRFKDLYDEPRFIGFIGKEAKFKSKVQSEMFWGYNDPEHANHYDERHREAGNNLHHILSSHYMFMDPDHEKAILRYTGPYGGVVNARLLAQHGRKIGKEIDSKGWGRHPYEKETVQHIEKHLSPALREQKTPGDMHVFSGMSFTPEHDTPKGRIHLPAYTSTSISRLAASGFGRAVPNSNYNFNSMTQQQVPHRQFKMLKDRFNAAHEFMVSDPENWHKQAKVATGKAQPEDFGPEFAHHYNFMESQRPTINKISPYQHMVRIHVPEGSHGAYVADHSDFPDEKEFIIHKGASIAINPTPEIDHNYKRVIWHSKLLHDGVAPTRHYNE